jgi:hypothetical protein
LCFVNDGLFCLIRFSENELAKISGRAGLVVPALSVRKEPLIWRCSEAPHAGQLGDGHEWQMA